MTSLKTQRGVLRSGRSTPAEMGVNLRERGSELHRLRISPVAMNAYPAYGCRMKLGVRLSSRISGERGSTVRAGFRVYHCNWPMLNGATLRMRRLPMMGIGIPVMIAILVLPTSCPCVESQHPEGYMGTGWHQRKSNRLSTPPCVTYYRNTDSCDCLNRK
ncbi:hypothetical protein BD779DRAFT_1567600 [Infundibulicybe gibba]|nr:hypothetical protein BD779DRAFT_1569594 [Infundibulicybe gibba]KAF8874123.1 hypothetical protein BD779DRAFT_1567600 [Infundibulicybe gibba]